MAGTSKKLIDKLARRTKKVRESASTFDRFDKVFLTPQTTQESPRAYELMRKVLRRIDNAFGHFPVAQKPLLHSEYVATSVTFSSPNIVVTFPTGLIGYGGSGVQVGDWVEITQQGSQLEGQYLKVTAVTSATVLHLSDVNFAGTTLPFSGTETNVTCRLEINGPKYYY